MKHLIINNLEFTQSQQTLAGEIEASNCERLLESLSAAGKGAQISYKLTGAAKQLRNPSLHLDIQAKLPVTCQRCLGEMQVQLSLDFNYIICNELPTEIDENDDTDWLEASPDMDVQALIEDEILLAMPIAPMHGHDCSKQSMQSGERANPFAVLKDKVKRKD